MSYSISTEKVVEMIYDKLYKIANIILAWLASCLKLVKLVKLVKLGIMPQASQANSLKQKKARKNLTDQHT